MSAVDLASPQLLICWRLWHSTLFSIQHPPIFLDDIISMFDMMDIYFLHIFISNNSYCSHSSHRHALGLVITWDCSSCKNIFFRHWTLNITLNQSLSIYSCLSSPRPPTHWSLYFLPPLSSCLFSFLPFLMDSLWPITSPFFFPTPLTFVPCCSSTVPLAKHQSSVDPLVACICLFGWSSGENKTPNRHQTIWTEETVPCFFINSVPSSISPISYFFHFSQIVILLPNRLTLRFQ